MSEETYVEEQRSVSGALLVTIVVSLLAALGGLVWCYSLQKNLGFAQTKLVAAEQKNVDLAQKLEATNARLRATSETLGQSVGMTQKQIEIRAQSIMAQQKAAQAKMEALQAAGVRVATNPTAAGELMAEVVRGL
jgi:succinyl-CoA synthetase alpha subunit